MLSDTDIHIGTMFHNILGKWFEQHDDGFDILG